MSAPSVEVGFPALAPCGDYGPETARRALETAIAAAGGLDWVQPGMRVGVKLNLCTAKRPEAAATTHPVLAAELTRMLVQRGAVVVLGDSPGGPFLAPLIRRLYETTGLRLSEQAGGTLNEDFGYTEVKNPEGKSLRRFAYVDWLRNCDAVINFCKLKSHGMMGMTAAVKNLYGVIPGTYKSEYHFQHVEPMNFADMLVDLDEYVRPRLHLVDAVDIMEGNGPTMGTPRRLGLLLAGTDPYRLDRLCAAGAAEYPAVATVGCGWGGGCARTTGAGAPPMTGGAASLPCDASAARRRWFSIVTCWSISYVFGAMKPSSIAAYFCSSGACWTHARNWRSLASRSAANTGSVTWYAGGMSAGAIPRMTPSAPSTILSTCCAFTNALPRCSAAASPSADVRQSLIAASRASNRESASCDFTIRMPWRCVGSSRMRFGRSPGSAESTSRASASASCAE